MWGVTRALRGYRSRDVAGILLARGGGMRTWLATWIEMRLHRPTKGQADLFVVSTSEGPFVYRQDHWWRRGRFVPLKKRGLDHD